MNDETLPATTATAKGMSIDGGASVQALWRCLYKEGANWSQRTGFRCYDSHEGLLIEVIFDPGRHRQNKRVIVKCAGVFGVSGPQTSGLMPAGRAEAQLSANQWRDRAPDKTFRATETTVPYRLVRHTLMQFHPPRYSPALIAGVIP
jgi:hypothetical protein